MICVVDVGYRPGTDGRDLAKVGVVGLSDWTDKESTASTSLEAGEVAPYQPGELWRRELAPVLAGVNWLIAEAGPVDVVVVDANVRLDQSGRNGLGWYVQDRLATSGSGQVPIVVGVAKTRFQGLDAVEVLRGDSQTPLFVTAVGEDEEVAADWIRSMAGPFRKPAMLTLADQLSR